MSGKPPGGGADDDLAPDIVRQRILIEGYYTLAVHEDVIGEFFGMTEVEHTAF